MNVILIVKKGSRGDPGNYMLVNLTSVPGKMAEIIIQNRIIGHIDKHSLLGKRFFKGKSCLINLLEFSEELKHVDKSDPTDMMYLDFQKASDKIPHQRLLSKLSTHKIKGKVLSWISKWLKYRKPRVKIKSFLTMERDEQQDLPRICTGTWAVEYIH